MSVLIIDDDVTFRAALEHDLSQNGYTVFVSAGFDSMVDVLLKVTPRTAIVDAHLPYGESRQVVKVLRRCGVPVILLKEHDPPVDQWRDEAITGDAALFKPVELIELEQCLSQLRASATR